MVVCRRGSRYYQAMQGEKEFNWADLRERLFAPVDAASLAFFRVVFGLILLWEVIRYFQNGWIAQYFILPRFHFAYYGFSWIEPLPPTGMYALFFALGALSLCITLGLWYRLSIILFFIGFTYVFLLDQARYLNHFYFVCMMALLLVFTPAHRLFSLDVLRKPSLRRDWAPAWSLWMLRTQLGIVYFYAGLAKINVDWLFRGEPMRSYIGDFTSRHPGLSNLLDNTLMVYFFSYGGLVFDLGVAPALLFKKTRPFAFAAAIFFHLNNAFIFHIGIFPWFALAATTLFFEPDWPRTLYHRMTEKKPKAAVAIDATVYTPSRRQQLVVGTLLALFFTYQVVFPLRHMLYPGNVQWTEEGGRFAWHMMRYVKNSEVKFYATDPETQVTWEVESQSLFPPHQQTFIQLYPDVIHQAAGHIATAFESKGYENVEVRAIVLTSLNKREPQLLIDPRVDLAHEPRSLRKADWILPGP